MAAVYGDEVQMGREERVEMVTVGKFSASTFGFWGRVKKEKIILQNIKNEFLTHGGACRTSLTTGVILDF